MNDFDDRNNTMLALSFLLALQGFFWLAVGLCIGWVVWGSTP